MSLSAQDRRRLFRSTRGRCFYCGLPLHPDRGTTHQVHGRDWLLPQARPLMAVDHCHPTQRGGSDDAGNLRPACSRCNSRKNLSTVEEFRLRLGLANGRLPYRFACEQEPSVQRDFIVVVSPAVARDMIAHNFPDAYGHRKYGGFGGAV